MKILNIVFDFFSSIKLAVILIVSIAAFLSYGTFYEASYGAQLAQKLVYQGVLGTILMALLIANLACAAISRLPWKKNHVGFVLTHLGIIVMLMGGFITQRRGLDGMLYLGLNETASYFSVDQTELRVYQSFDGKPFVQLFQDSVDFDRRPPPAERYNYKLVDDDVLKITNYLYRAQRKVEVKGDNEPSSQENPAFKFSLSNDKVDVEEWVGLTPELPPYYDFGPALITFVSGQTPLLSQMQNQIVITKGLKNLSYAIYSKKQKQPTSQGAVEVGKEIPTGWMNLKFKVIEYHRSAKVNINYDLVSHDHPQGVSVLKAQIGSKSSWFELDSPHEIRGDKTKYFLSFIRKRYDLGFKITLSKFKMGLYGGTANPSSYESTVKLDNSPTPVVISMNEPLKYKGFTLYQSSFEQNERGEAIASIFSVNYDPGRWIKYFGASCMVLGITTMFYWKPKWSRKKRTA